MGQVKFATRPAACAGCSDDIPVNGRFTWRQPYDGGMLCAECSHLELPPIAQIDDAGKNWSQYQKDFFRFVRESDRSGQLQACAGSGKTTSLRRAALEVPNARIKYLVFNKMNADDAKRPYSEGGMPPFVDSGTFHSLGWSSLSRHLNLKTVNGSKTYDILEKLVAEGYSEARAINGHVETVVLDQVTKAEYDAWAPSIKELVSLAKNHGIDGRIRNDTIDEWTELVDEFGIEFDQPEVRCHICGALLTWGVARCRFCKNDREPETTPFEQRAIEVARLTLKASNQDLSQVDFDDQLYLVVRLGLAIPQYDIVFVDEVQDTSPTRLALLAMAVRDGGRCISVGDSHQAIYHWAGALHNAMEQVAEDWNAVVMPLSINYRCSKAVVRHAQKLVPEIEYWEGSPEGSVETIHEPFPITDFLPTDAILCRVNAPNISLAYRFIAAGIPCQVLGRDIGAGLVALVKKLCGKSKRHQPDLDEMLERLDGYQEREVAKWVAKHKEDTAQSIEDKCESIRAAANALPEGSRTIDELIDRLNSLFADPPKPKPGEKPQPRVTLSSAHKSKGLEYPRVFILDPWRMPSPWARSGTQLVQEENLAYVACTRAQVDLRFIDLEDITG